MGGPEGGCAGGAAQCRGCRGWHARGELYALLAPCWPGGAGGGADPDISVLQVLLELRCFDVSCENKMGLNDEYNMWMCNVCLLRARSSYQFQQMCRESQRQLITEQMQPEAISTKKQNKKKKINVKNKEEMGQSTRKNNRTPKGTNKAQEQLYGSDLWQPVSCSDCKKTFSNVPTLLAHRRSEHMSRFQCLHCGVSLTTSRGLRLHLRSHTGARPEVCSTCGAAFSDPRTLRIHEKRHAGTLPHECTTCGRQFPARIPLERHRMTHHT